MRTLLVIAILAIAVAVISGCGGTSDIELPPFGAGMIRMEVSVDGALQAQSTRYTAPAGASVQIQAIWTDGTGTTTFSEGNGLALTATDNAVAFVMDGERHTIIVTAVQAETNKTERGTIRFVPQ